MIVRAALLQLLAFLAVTAMTNVSIAATEATSSRVILSERAFDRKAVGGAQIGQSASTKWGMAR